MENQFKKGDKVLVKDVKDAFWIEEVFIAYNDIGPYKYVTVGEDNTVTGWMQIKPSLNDLIKE